MRISLSVMLGALFSFFLLVTMSRLISNTELPTEFVPRTVADAVVTPANPIKPEVRQSKLPKAPEKVTMPRQPSATIDVDKDGTTVVALPPGDGGPGVISERPSIGPIGPGRLITETEQVAAEAALQPLQQVPPLYPRELAARGVEGWVMLSFDVRQDGSVGNIRVRDSKPRGAFDDAARKAVQRWRYQPGLSSPAEQSVKLNFSLEN